MLHRKWFHAAANKHNNKFLLQSLNFEAEILTWNANSTFISDSENNPVQLF